MPARPAPVLALAALAAVGGVPAARGDCARLDDFRQVLDLELRMDPADWDLVRRDATFEEERTAWFRCGDEERVPVRVRRKRSGALPSDRDPVKVSLKIDFDDLLGDLEWHGHRKIGLENGIYDPAAPSALVREGIAWILMARAGAVAGGVSWVRLTVNGEALGVLLRVEEIDKSFLRRRLGEDEGFLYKLDRRSPEVRRRLTRVGETDPFAPSLCFPPFDEACEPPADGLGHLRAHLDIHQLVTMGAVNTLVANTDGLLEADNNYSWYNSALPRRYFPWDLDLSLPPWGARNFPHVSEVERRLFLAAPTLRPYFDTVLLRLIDDLLAPEAIDLLLDELSAAIGPSVEADPLSGLAGGFAAEVESVRGWLREREAFLRDHLAPRAPHPLVLNEVLASSRDGDRDEGGETAPWVEVHNRGTRDVSLDGLHLSDDPARPLRWALPAVSLPAGGFIRIWCDGDLREGPFHAGFGLDAEGGAVGLYEGPGGAAGGASEGIVRAIDFVRFGPQEPDVALGRWPDGAPGLRSLPCPTPGAPNRATCGDAEFVRGDVESDGRRNVADAAAILEGLFRGAGLSCRDAADADDDGSVAVTDAVALLLHLFAGGEPPPAPFPGCGPDATEDGLGCERAAACGKIVRP